jgi:lauroyl/myristoyl acyltransferase
MSTQQTPDLSAALDAIARQPPPPRMPPASLGILIKTSPLLRKLVPTRLVVHRAARQGQALWEHGCGEREQAMSIMESIVAGTSRAEEVEELARQYLIESQVDTALSWQPWSAQMDADSSALLHEIRSQRRGMLLSACHLGAFYRTMHAFPAGSRSHYTVAGPWLFDPPSHDYWGRRLALWRKSALGHLVLSKGSFPILRELLARGESVYLFFDLPGQHETCFLGKPAMLADGSSRLAFEADSLIVPLRARRAGHRVWVDVGTPLDPREFSGAEALHGALAAHHEHWILDNPAAMADPNSFGWDHGAGPQTWIRP